MKRSNFDKWQQKDNYLLMFGINFGGGLELLKPQCHKELSNYRVDTTQDAQGVVPIFCLERQYQKKEGQKD